MSSLFSYCDIDIYEDDAKLFVGRHWLNDSCISLSFKLLEEHLSMPSAASKFLFFNPMIVSCIKLQFDCQEEFDELAAMHEVENHEWLFLPLNDSMSFEQASTHWSLLLYHIPSGESFHFDPSGNYNYKSAMHFVKKLHEFLPHTSLKITNANACPQETNSFDCGVYTILFAEAMATYLNESCDEDTVSSIDKLKTADCAQIFHDITPQTVSNYRVDMQRTIQRLSRQKK